MNQFTVLLRMERKPIIAWSVGSALFVGLMGFMFVALGGEEGLTELAEGYPPEILEIIGADEFTSVTGFLNAEFGSFAPIVFGIFLVMLMTKHLAGAEESGRLDHVLARPVPRTRYYWHLLLAGATIYAIILSATLVLALVGFFGAATGRELLGIVGLIADMFPIGLVWIGFGGFLGAAFHHRGLANGIGAGVVAFMFILDMASRVSTDAAWLSWLTPMGYLSKSDLAAGDPAWTYYVFSIVMGGLLAFAGWKLFEQKDLYA